ncbi:bifunctional 2-polyprenyl-6-hydroxyphenol methylase/3-demethylubiquinol 3-O-methyltransferase UbiG [Hasllibacter sp. MH4015]|uniref:class I SAM-dependent methyltransferase n=1 Tax=Hasllibacter sp. MH4015 TaxID=2854029 RepID=UPI001CD259B7|nr:class I SAM-dependent methyltransferase [Hasllibacter sp. MH4015]
MTDEKTIAIYEEQAARYADLPVSPLQRAAIDRFLAMVPPGACILDAGCGPGVHAALMASAGHDVHAIDPTPAFVTDALSRGVNARLGAFDDIDGADIYDGIFASFSLLHAPLADLPRHLDAMVRALKPGGALFIGMKSGTGEERDKIGRRYSYVTEAEMRQLLEMRGLTIAHVTSGEEAGLSGEIAPFFLMHARAADA